MNFLLKTVLFMASDMYRSGTCIHSIINTVTSFAYECLKVGHFLFQVCFYLWPSSLDFNVSEVA